MTLKERLAGDDTGRRSPRPADERNLKIARPFFVDGAHFLGTPFLKRFFSDFDHCRPGIGRGR